MQIRTPIKQFWCFFTIISITLEQENLFTENISEATFSDIFKSAEYPKVGDIPLLNRKIFKGDRVTVQEHPYVVSIRRFFSHFLTGTLLANKLVITVAHPLYEVPIFELGVVTGETYADRGTTIRSVVLVVVHENFNSYTLEADIAILRLYEELVFKISVKPIELLTPSSSTLADKTGFVTGWGRCDLTGKELCLPRSTKYFSNEKMDPMMRTISFVITSANYYCDGYERHGTSLRPGMLCVGVAREENPVGPCLAVPGSPLVIDANLAGILSWGFGCGYYNDLPLVYTDVRYYQPWILHNVAILKGLSNKNFSQMFQAMKAYTLFEWLQLTRQKIAVQSILNLKKYVDGDFMIKNLDSELKKLKGSLFDIRDFVFNGEFHDRKRKLMETLRNETFKVESSTSFVNFTTVTPMPFLNESKLIHEQQFEENDVLEREYYIDTKTSGDYDDENDTGSFQV